MLNSKSNLVMIHRLFIVAPKREVMVSNHVIKKLAFYPLKKYHKLKLLTFS